MVREHFRAQPLKKMIWPDTSGNPDTHSALAVILAEQSYAPHPPAGGEETDAALALNFVLC